ncbi:MAG: DUF5685 family protein [Acutalibacteraceae bacterium]
MFGYVKCDKGELKVREYEAYRGLYCSLCKAMGRHFGVFSRLTLSYDMTFFLLMRLSFSSHKPDFKGGRCPFNPAKRCNYCQNADDELKFAAAVSMMMFYYKVKDNISDSPFFKKLLMYLILPFAFFKYKKAKKLFPDLEKIISASMKKQSETESKNTAYPDEAAHHSADALGKLLSYGMSDGGNIYRFGYAVGKWVYLCDAAQDIEKDVKDGSFNVFVNMFKIKKGDKLTPAQKEIIEGNLNFCLDTLSECFKKAENKTLVPIAENIIYGGTLNTMNRILKGNIENERPL